MTYPQQPPQGVWLGQQATATQPQPYNQFGQQPQGWAPPVAGPNLAIGGADAPQTAGTAPTITHMMMQPGRLVAIIPTRLERNVKAPGNEGNTQDRITADVLIIDGGPITYGGKPWARPPVPDTHVVQQLPYLATNVWISNKILVTQLERKVGSGIVVGRLIYGEARGGNNAPYKLTEDPTPEEVAFVTQWWAAYQAGQFQNPPATPLAPVQGFAGVQSFTPQMQSPPNTFAAAGFTPLQQPGMPAGTAPVQMASAPPMQAAPAAYAPDPWAQAQAATPMAPTAMPSFTAPAAPAMPAAAPVSAPQAPESDWTLTTYPPGFPEEHKAFWGGQTTKEQRVQLLAQHGINGPGQPPTGL